MQVPLMGAILALVTGCVSLLAQASAWQQNLLYSLLAVCAVLWLRWMYWQLRYYSLKQLLCHAEQAPALFTAWMAMMSFSAAFATPIANILWASALAAHLLCLAYFAYQRQRLGDWSLRHHGWFVPVIGLAVAIATAPIALPMTAYWWLLLVCYLAMWPWLWRAQRKQQFRPALAICMAPPHLLLVAWLNSHHSFNHPIVAILLACGLLAISLVVLHYRHWLQCKWQAGYAALTFPLMITAKAYWLISLHLPAQQSWLQAIAATFAITALALSLCLLWSSWCQLPILRRLLSAQRQPSL